MPLLNEEKSLLKLHFTRAIPYSIIYTMDNVG